MSLVILPDVERLISGFLRAQPEVTALVDQRVYTAVPAVKTWPLVRLTRISGADRISRPLVLDEAVLQIDAWGGPKAQAYETAATVRAVLSDRLIGVHDEGVVQDVRHGGLTYLPDDDYTPSRPRYLFTVIVRTRAHAQPGS